MVVAQLLIDVRPLSVGRREFQCPGVPGKSTVEREALARGTPTGEERFRRPPSNVRELWGVRGPGKLRAFAECRFVVEGDEFGELLGPVRAEAGEPVRHGRVRTRSSCERQAAVGDVPDERVLEAVFDLA